MVTIHKKLTRKGGGGHSVASGILGKISVQKATDRIIAGVRKNENYIIFPSFMTHLTTTLKVFPHAVTKKILNLIYAL